MKKTARYKHSPNIVISGDFKNGNIIPTKNGCKILYFVRFLKLGTVDLNGENLKSITIKSDTADSAIFYLELLDGRKCTIDVSGVARQKMMGINI